MHSSPGHKPRTLWFCGLLGTLATRHDYPLLCSLLLLCSVDKRTQDPVCLHQGTGAGRLAFQPSRSGRLDFLRVSPAFSPQPLAVFPSQGARCNRLPRPPQPRSGDPAGQESRVSCLPALSCLCGRTSVSLPCPCRGLASPNPSGGCPSPPAPRHRPNPEPPHGGATEPEGKTRGDRVCLCRGWGSLRSTPDRCVCASPGILALGLL